MKKHRFLILFLLFVFLLMLSFPVQSASRVPGDLITNINDLRASSRLNVLEENKALSSAAQNQADYLASVYGGDFEKITDFHSRPDGTNEFERVLSAGYAIAPGWFVDEVAFADDAASTTLDAFKFWRESTANLNILLNKEAVQIGVGISEGEDFAYYVAVFGIDYSAGAAANTGVASTLPTAAITQEIAPVSVAIPNEDGSVFHEVQTGETLWGIAIAYEVTGDQIIALNNLGENGIIYEGAVLQIRPAYTPTPKPSVTPTSPPPTRTPIPAQTARAVNTPAPKEDDQADGGIFGLGSQNIGLALILISGVGLVLIVVGMLTKNKSSRDEKSE